MMIHPIIESLRKLRLKGIAEALEIQLKNPESKNLLFEERMALLLDHEIGIRERKRLESRLKKAKLKHQAYMQDVIYESSRKLDRSLFLSFETCGWISDCKNILITGLTGTGKSYLADALAHNACMKGFSVRRVQFPRFFHEMTAAKADGTYLKMQAELAKAAVLVIDDFCVAPFSDENRRDLLEIMDDRYNKASTIVTSQLPIEHWHEALGDATLADAILDRLIHNSYKIALEGDSLRKKLSIKTTQ
jgi:DNA replication protein DnaC